MQVFKKMRMPQIRDPSLPKLEDLPQSYKSKVPDPAALVWCKFGPTNYRQQAYSYRQQLHVHQQCV
jgi:hypothetical protein